MQEDSMEISTQNKSAIQDENQTVPEIMNAAAIDRFGGPEVLTTHKLRVPALDKHEVLIALHTAGVGVWDAAIRGGWMPDGGTPKFPMVLGSDGSGAVAAVGSGVHRYKPGDAVYAYSFENAIGKGGFYAGYVVVDADRVAPIPRGLDLAEAGAIPTTGLTALQGIDDALKLKRGETIIIHAASGGVGTLAVQFAKLRGARVLATASGANGVALVRSLGADLAIDGKHGDIQAAAREFAPEGVDAVLGFAGGEAFEKCAAAIHSGGRLAYPHGVEPAPGKRSDIRTIAYDAVPGVAQFTQLTEAVEAAKVKVVIAAAFPLGEAARCHERLAKGNVLGKIVLRMH
jgi:NADPH:quinone reductase-like Zn-dependent oxidoreductase